MGKGAVASTEERLTGPEPALSWHQLPRAEPGDEGKKKTGSAEQKAPARPPGPTHLCDSSWSEVT